MQGVSEFTGLISRLETVCRSRPRLETHEGHPSTGYTVWDDASLLAATEVMREAEALLTGIAEGPGAEEQREFARARVVEIYALVEEHCGNKSLSLEVGTLHEDLDYTDLCCGYDKLASKLLDLLVRCREWLLKPREALPADAPALPKCRGDERWFTRIQIAEACHADLAPGEIRERAVALKHRWEKLHARLTRRGEWLFPPENRLVKGKKQVLEHPASWVPSMLDTAFNYRTITSPERFHALEHLGLPTDRPGDSETAPQNREEGDAQALT